MRRYKIGTGNFGMASLSGWTVLCVLHFMACSDPHQGKNSYNLFCNQQSNDYYMYKIPMLSSL